MKLLFSILCLFVLTSCSTFSKDGTEVITRPFSDVDSERKIVLSVGRTFEIVLPSNPTTGYSWTLLIENPKIISNESHAYTPDAGGRVGVGGNTIWNLKARKEGETSLTFSYQRPWEENTQPTKVVSFTVSVN
ncbi:MAG: protease inhibitor I42 family protein [Phycisphaerae bacterium]|jgi:inhibitor of cysteine peptidase|nr:protease inhibitor I42 family protein [Phycisphaerae bacterium]MBT5365573.1 protease inhibitor I42 family protein [Phycisphaerae bacterium]MBT6269576.1 protease inhibitor I42 family protein [Phycisphaerae bacterium]MBT6282843.1 protease inhibitor I42 family protein [Phycisphaerae bacterium]